MHTQTHTYVCVYIYIYIYIVVTHCTLLHCIILHYVRRGRSGAARPRARAAADYRSSAKQFSKAPKGNGIGATASKNPRAY